MVFARVRTQRAGMRASARACALRVHPLRGPADAQVHGSMRVQTGSMIEIGYYLQRRWDESRGVGYETLYPG